jgi:hypothetical protein
MNRKKRGELILTLFLLAFFIFLMLISMTYSLKARRMPLVVIIPGIVLCTVMAFRIATGKKDGPKQPKSESAETENGESPGLEGKEVQKRMWVMFGWMGLLVGMIWIVGFLVTIPVYTILFMRSLKESWRLSIIIGVVGFIVLYFLFVVGLEMELYPGLIYEWLSMYF